MLPFIPKGLTNLPTITWLYATSYMNMNIQPHNQASPSSFVSDLAVCPTTKTSGFIYRSNGKNNPNLGEKEVRREAESTQLAAVLSLDETQGGKHHFQAHLSLTESHPVSLPGCVVQSRP